MMWRKLLFFLLILLLISAALVSAQSLMNYNSQRFVLVSGGSAASQSFAVTSVTGQPITSVTNSAHYQVSGGFLFPHQPGYFGVQRIYLPLIRDS